MTLATLLPILHRRLCALPAFADLALAQLQPLPTTGLAHDHVRVGATGLLLRVPKQSQLGLAAAANLAYQAACFQRAAASGHTPRLHGTLPPDAELPMGALLVDEIPGRVVRLPDELPALAQALAAIHALPLPEPAARPPLKNPPDPVADTLREVLTQAEFLAAAGLHPQALAMIRQELALATQLPLTPPPVTLIAFDAHPGNFLLDQAGRALLVDLEKARYGVPAFDLAHATLYTSTTWDVATYAELSIEQVAALYRHWLERVPADLAANVRPWLLPLRRIMWLWSVTWCAKWRVQSAQQATTHKHDLDSTEDWSTDLSTSALIRHVAGRVDDYLHPATIAKVRADWSGSQALTALTR